MNPNRIKQAVSTWPAAALVVSNMIGIGVFTSLSFQILGFNTPNGTSLLTNSVFPIMMLWVVGGFMALCGALCYAELATALPKSGGEYNFLSRIYHPMVGFCTGLTSVIVGFTAPIAISALAFGQYICQAFPALTHAMPNAEYIMAFLLVAGATLSHLRSLRFSGEIQAVTTAITVLLLISFVVFGFSTSKPQPIVFHPHGADWGLLLSGAFLTSLFWVEYSYSGWNAAAYIVDEVRNPGKALPRALILGTGFVMVLYVAVNAVFLYSTPLGTLANPNLVVAHTAGVQIFGEAGARIVSLLICVGLVANVSGMMWVGSRVTEAMGTNYPKLAFFGRVSETRVPYVALIFQFVIVFTFLFCNPAEIVNYVSSVLWFWSLMTVIGLIVLRFREPELARPYRTWGYPVTPIVYAAVTIFCLYTNCSYHPKQSAIGAVTVLLGIPLYLWVSRNGPTKQPQGEAPPMLETSA